MRGFGRKGKSDAEDEATDLPRLSWPVQQDGQDLIVSVIPSRVPGDQRMHAVDVLGEEGDASPERGTAADLISSLTRAAAAPGTVAIQGFALSAPSDRVLTFTLAVSLADIPYPETGELPDHDVSRCQLPCGPALRIFKWVQADIGSDDSGQVLPPIPMFGTTYLAQTEYGVLALAFATPHVDGAREFAVLFEAIAQTCTIQPAPSGSAEVAAT
ncbi:MAG TPA: hypothetical protein VME22_21285 [Solirubrobacteraceae bacterium]|nr:hypothetical protein [Solirubrobacteraceae bacterium]